MEKKEKLLCFQPRSPCAVLPKNATQIPMEKKEKLLCFQPRSPCAVLPKNATKTSSLSKRNLGKKTRREVCLLN
tara:strand:+ start:538 stop:759 length:222 start_codon:yes stop_codon:yes gene_type:complete